VFSLVLLVELYRTLDIGRVGEALLGADLMWLAISVGMIIPITFLRAVRFYWVAPSGALPGLGEAFRLTVVASALNVFAPAKAGDLVKSYFIATRSRVERGVALSIVVYERLCDMFGLIAWCVMGWLVGRPEIDGIGPSFWLALGLLGGVCFLLTTSEVAARSLSQVAHAVLPSGRFAGLRRLVDGWPGLLSVLHGRRRWIVSYSLVLWLTHLFQIWLFTVALRVPVPFTVCASFSAVALIAGQLPFTFAGMGARDVVLVVLLARYMTPERAAAMGVLISTRQLLPPLLGLPVMRPYLSTVVEDARRWRRQSGNTV
jgi:glycosyltransferase 2 family protein